MWLYSWEQYSVHRFSISRSSVRHFPKRSWMVVAFPCFTVVKSFTSWYALLLLLFPRFSSMSLHCSPIQFSFVVFRHPLMFLFTSLYLFLRSFRFESFLSQFSPFVAHIKKFCSVPGFFSSDDVCQGSHWLFESLLYWRWWSLNPCLYLHCT